MNGLLPVTGTAALLDELSPFIPDDFINRLLPRHRGRGRKSDWTPAQLYRVMLLPLLTPARSFNLVVELLNEQRAWRQFAHLPNRRHLPVASQLCQFREDFGVAQLRETNRHLLLPILEGTDPQRKSVALIDSTDLPAATSAFKKNHRPLLCTQSGPWWAHNQNGPKPLVCRLQETHASFLGQQARPSCNLGAVGILDRTRKSR